MTIAIARFGPSQRRNFAREECAPLLGELVGLLDFVVVNVAGTLGFRERPSYLILSHAPLQPILQRIKSSWLTVLQSLQDSILVFAWELRKPARQGCQLWTRRCHHRHTTIGIYRMAIVAKSISSMKLRRGQLTDGRRYQRHEWTNDHAELIDIANRDDVEHHHGQQRDEQVRDSAASVVFQRPRIMGLASPRGGNVVGLLRNYRCFCHDYAGPKGRWEAPEKLPQFLP